MIKKIRLIYIIILIIALPVSLYTFVYATSVNSYGSVKSVNQPNSPATSLADSSATPIGLADNLSVITPTSKPVMKKTTPVKKKIIKKKSKPKETLMVTPALITPDTAPHTAR